MYFDKLLYNNNIEEVVEKYKIQELVEYERYCRDRQLWEQMEQCYDENSRVQISWFTGSGKEFIEASKNMKGASHKNNNTVVWLNKNRGIAEILTCIQMRFSENSVEYDLLSYARVLYRVEKRDERWRIISMECIYERDSIIPTVPMGGLQIKPEELRQGRYSYQCLAYVLKRRGETINENLPGEDKPDTIKELYQNVFSWLEE